MGVSRTRFALCTMDLPRTERLAQRSDVKGQFNPKRAIGI